jgi:hypothetical protein
MNGSPTDVETSGRSIGAVLAELDERAEKAGAIITGIRYNGNDLLAEAIPDITESAADGPGIIELHAEPVADMKARAIDSLLQLVKAAALATDRDTIQVARKAWSTYRTSFDGLYSVEELSFLDAFVTALDAGNSKAIAEIAAKLTAFFSERLAELQDPLAAMAAASRLFHSLAQDLADVPVRLQTGREADGMRTMVLVVELINKTVRLLPDFVRSVPGAAELRIEGKDVGDFYSDFNHVLRELASAFENRDSVLIGDLAEYELLPRLKAFFTAISTTRA